MLELLFSIYFHFLVAIRGFGAFTAAERPFPCETSSFPLPSVALAKAKLPGGFISSYWSRKSRNNISFVGKLLSPWLAWLGAGWQQELQHFYFPVLRDKDGFPSFSKGLLHPSESVGSERTCQNPSRWGWINILCIINTNSVYKPKRQLPSCAAPVTCTSKGAAQLLSAVNFFVCPVPIIAKLQSQGTFLPLRIMGVLTLKNNVASAGVKLLAGLTCCSV